MKLSVVMPSFNKSSYLIEMVDTIKTQTFKDWELIIVDDGSDEKNYHDISAAISNDNRIKLIKRNRQPKNGDTCRNIGMDMAQGEYLIIFDSDDLVTETCFERRVAFMDSHPHCDYASFPSSCFVDGTKNLKPYRLNRGDGNNLECILSANYPFTVWANIYRRSSLYDIRWDENVYIYQDFDFMVQCELKGLKHGWAPNGEPDYYYRIFRNGNSVSTTVITQQKVESTNYLFEKISNQLETEKEKHRLKSRFFRFNLYFYEQLLLNDNEEFVRSYLSVVNRIYLGQYSEMTKIFENTHGHVSSHFDKFKMYARLYYAFRVPQFKSFMIHEFVKALIHYK